MGLTSPPQLETGDIKVSIMLGEILLEVREEGIRSKYGVYQYDTVIKSDHIQNGLSPHTGKPPASVFCSRLLENPGTLSL